MPGHTQFYDPPSVHTADKRSDYCASNPEGQNDELDEALERTFPASDPVSLVSPLISRLPKFSAPTALGKDYSSVTEGIALVLTIVAWEYTLDWLAWRFPKLRPLLKPQPLKLIEDGRMLEQGMRVEMLTEDELASQLRQKGVMDIGEVEVACLEGDGQLSVSRKRPYADLVKKA